MVSCVEFENFSHSLFDKTSCHLNLYFSVYHIYEVCGSVKHSVIPWLSFSLLLC